MEREKDSNQFQIYITTDGPLSQNCHSRHKEAAKKAARRRFISGGKQILCLTASL
jgi:hypothetical protein